jgi:hypothetical protein
MMAADYPTTVTSFATLVDYVDWVLASHQNTRALEIVAIETALGTNPQGNAASLKARLAHSLDDNGYLNFDSATELTLASDAITVTQTAHKLQPQTGTTDNLSTINGTEDGDFGVLYVSDFGTDTITIKHNVGNILCVSGADISLSNGAIAWFSNGTKVFVIGDGGGAGASPAALPPYPAFVRLSVLTGNPNPTSEESAKTSVFAMPHKGDTYPQWDGSKFFPQTFAELTLSLNAAHTSASIYDVYLWLDSATVRVVTGPAWASASSRGTGAGTAEKETLYGVDVNKVSMTVRNGASTYTMPARYGTLIGTIVMSANGQVNWKKDSRCIYNKYNRFPVELHVCPAYADDAAHTTYTVNSSTAYIEANGANNGRVVFVLGEAQSVNALVLCRCAPPASSYVLIGIGWDSVTESYVQGWSAVGTASGNCFVSDNNKGAPLGIGSHYIALLLSTYAAGTHTIYADTGAKRQGATTDPEGTYLTAHLEM